MSETGTQPAPHGGTWIETPGGAVEISVFETGVPPHFRLYFFDSAHRSVPAPPPSSVTIETRRPGGATQHFRFESERDYLRSLDDIPEPHEFELRLSVTGAVGTAVYDTAFTEEDHGHDHSGHDHLEPGARVPPNDQPLESASGHGHAHDLPAGRNSRHGHSHDEGGHHGHTHGVVDPSIATSDRGMWALKWSFVALMTATLLQVVVVVLSHSVALLADTIHNFGDAATAIPLGIAFWFAKRKPNRKFPYGYGRVEDLAGQAIVLTILVSALVAGYESIQRLLHPHHVDHLWAVAAAAVIGFVGNEVAAVIRLRVGREINSAALIADGYHARTDGWVSLSVLLGALAVWLGFPIADPILGLIITLAIFQIVWQSATAIFTRMLDGVEPEIMDQLEEGARAVPGVQSVCDVRARWIGHKLQADVSVAVEPELTVTQGHTISRQVQQALTREMPVLGFMTVHVDPTTEAGESHHGEDPSHADAQSSSAPHAGHTHSHEGGAEHSH